MKKLGSLLLALSLLGGIMIPTASALEVQSAPREVYLEPEQIDEETIVYRDENGEILAISKPAGPSNSDSDLIPLSTNATVYGFSCTLSPSKYKHDTRKFNATDSVTIYFDVDFSRSGDTYIGYYADRPDTYYWLNTTYTNGARNYVLIGGGTNVYFAIKNASNYSIKYDARYSTAEFS